MKWRVEFYHERRGILVRYDIEAASPGAAVLAGRNALRGEHPSPPAGRRRLSLFDRAKRAASHDDSGWVLYRLGKDNGHEPLRSVAGGAGGPDPGPA